MGGVPAPPLAFVHDVARRAQARRARRDGGARGRRRRRSRGIPGARSWTMTKDATKGADLEAALAELPIFPLPHVVLFPRALLPLHVFEPRYRAMLKDALETHRAIAMAMVL